jgi:hypothetical protein
MAGLGEVSVNVKLTFWEVYRINVYMILRAFRVLLIPVAVIVLMLLVFLSYILFHPSPENTFEQLLESSGTLPYLILGLVVFFFGVPLLSAWKSQSNCHIREGAGYLLSESGVNVHTAVGRANLTWAAFVRAIETRDFFLLYVMNGMAHPLPKRSFGSEGEVRIVRELVRHNLKKVRLRG